MAEPDQSAWRQFESVHTGDLSVEAFEAWVYSYAGLEPLIGAALALELLAFDYRQPDAHHEIQKLIQHVYAQHRPGQLGYDMMRRVADEFLAGERDLWRTAAPFARLVATGDYDWIPLDFLYVDSELDSIPHPDTRTLWLPHALRQVLENNEATLRSYEKTIREAVTVVLKHLELRADPR